MSVIVHNRYFATPGREAEALQTRQRASQVRAAHNRPVGRILLATGEQEGDAPDFIWECEYADLESRQADLDWANASADFEAVRIHMGTLLERFERLTFRVV